MVSAVITGAGKGTAAEGSSAGDSAKTVQSSSFGAIMAKSLSGNAAVKNNAAQSAGTSVKTAQDMVEKQPGVDKDRLQPQDLAGRKETASLTDTKETAEADIPDEAVSKLEEAADNVAGKIKELLGVSDEALEEALSVLGLTMAELLQPSNLTQVILQLTGSQDAMTLLTDADLSANLKALLSFAGQEQNLLSQELDMTPQALDTLIELVSEMERGLGMETTDVQQLAETTDLPEETQAVHAEHSSDSAGESQSETMEQVLAQKMTVNDQQTAKHQNGMTGGQQQAGQSNTERTQTDMTAGTMTQQLGQTFETVFTTGLDAANPVDIVRQIVDTIRVTNTQMLQSMEIQLNPENLGKVNVLVTAREGVITAQITAENEQVKRAIEGQMSTLKESFENQGIKVEAVEVTVQSHSFEANQNFSNQEADQQETARTRKKLRPEDLMFSEEEDEEENMQADLLRRNENSSVEYTA